MATQIIPPERIKRLNDQEDRGGDYVLYWMEQSRRATCNHALEFAVRQANERGQRLLVCFVAAKSEPKMTLRQATFMMEGIQQTRDQITSRGIKMVVRCGHPVEVIGSLAEDASMVVCDRGYLRHQKSWRADLADNLNCSLLQVESDAVVPVDTVSDKREYAARTIRPKIHEHLDDFLEELSTTAIEKDSTSLSVSGEDVSKIEFVLDQMNLDRSVPAVSDRFRGGSSQASAKLKQFMEGKLPDYTDDRSSPEQESLSHMSMYLHFGQISPLEIALKIKETSSGKQKDRDSYLEELIVRRELSQNFANFTDDYDAYSCLPDWAQETLDDHRGDPRDHPYTITEMEDSETDDQYWNAAMREMRHTGYMHNHMRMYWGKQILAWTNTPDYAYRVALELNNKYFLDGNDANSFANVAWLFGNHDRAFGEREVFGKVRTMTASGLQRKAEPQKYVQRVEEMLSSFRC